MGPGVTEHRMEDRLGHGVETGEHPAALGADRVGRVEYRGDPPLLFQGWEWALQLSERFE